MSTQAERPTDKEVLETIDKIRSCHNTKSVRKKLSNYKSDPVKIITIIKELSAFDVDAIVRVEVIKGIRYIIDCEEGLSEITGYPIKDLIGQSLDKIIIPTNPNELEETLKNLDKGKLILKKSSIMRKDGDFIETNGFLVKEKRKDKRKIFIELVFPSHNITEI